MLERCLLLNVERLIPMLLDAEMSDDAGQPVIAVSPDRRWAGPLVGPWRLATAAAEATAEVQQYRAALAAYPADHWVRQQLQELPQAIYVPRPQRRREP